VGLPTLRFRDPLSSAVRLKFRTALTIQFRVALVIIVTGFSFLLIQELSLSTAAAQSPDRNREPHGEMALLGSSIYIGHEAHVQLTIVTPGASKTAWQGEIVVTVPDYARVSKSSSGPSGGSTTIHLKVAPIAPGSAAPQDFWVIVSPESIGRFAEIKALVRMQPVSEEVSEIRYSKLIEQPLEIFPHVKPGEIQHCEGIDSQYCDEQYIFEDEFLQPVCSDLLCEPWGRYLIAYATIAGSLVARVFICQVVNKY
jgi:hypothetical protein